MTRLGSDWVVDPEDPGEIILLRRGGMTLAQWQRITDILEACGVAAPVRFADYVALFASTRLTPRLLEDAIWLALWDGTVTVTAVCDYVQRLRATQEATRPPGRAAAPRSTPTRHQRTYGVAYWMEEAATRDGYEDAMRHRVPGSFGTGKRR